MYFPIFSLSKYYFNKDTTHFHTQHHNNKEDICLICWLPGNEQDEINILTNFNHIVTKCKCKHIFHKSCIDKWIKKSPTCPICRTRINVVFVSNGITTVVNCCIKCITYVVITLQFLCYISFCIIFYNAICLYYMIN